MRSRFDSQTGTEALFDEANTAFSGQEHSSKQNKRFRRWKRWFRYNWTARFKSSIT